MIKRTNIEWSEYTWKIATGCNHGCPYCYCRRFMKDMTPKYHPDRIEDPMKLKKPARVFVANTGDLFGEWVKDWMIEDVLQTVKLCPQHTFQFLTKNAKRYEGMSFPDNSWVGVSVTKQEDVHRIDSLRSVRAKIKFVSFEPILGHINEVDLFDIDWVIIGGESVGQAWNPKNETQSKTWAAPLISKVRSLGIPIFLKPNLRWPERIREFPNATDMLDIPNVIQQY